RLVLHNTGWLPTYVTKMALQRKQLRGTLAKIALPQGATLVSGKPREELGELEGRAYLHTSVSVWPTKKPTQDIAYVDWVVRAPAGTSIELTAWHDRAGRVRRQVRLA